MFCNWRSLADECVSYSRSKGFLPTTWDTAPIRIGCICREVEEFTEALEQWGGRRHKINDHAIGAERCAAQDELADVAIYALVMLSDLSAENWAFRGTLFERVDSFAAPDRIARPLRRYATKALESWRIGSARDLCTGLELVVLLANELCLTLFKDRIDTAVRLRLSDMAGRPVLHGSKDPRS